MYTKNVVPYPRATTSGVYGLPFTVIIMCFRIFQPDSHTPDIENFTILNASIIIPITLSPTFSVQDGDKRKHRQTHEFSLLKFYPSLKHNSNIVKFLP